MSLSQIFNKSIPGWYVISILFGIFVYYTRTPVNINDVEIPQFDTNSYKSDPSYIDPSVFQSTTDRLAHPVEYAEFPYAGEDLTFLPVAPYRETFGKFDFRATHTIYLENLKNFIAKSMTGGSAGGVQPPILNFHWRDFLDLTLLDPLLREKPDCFRIGALGANSRTPWINCLDEPENLGFVFINPSLEPETDFRLSMRGKSYLYSAAPIPNKLIFLSGELAFVSKVGKKVSLNQGLMIDEFIQRKLKSDTGLSQLDIIKAPVSPVTELYGIAQILNRDLNNLNTPLQSTIDVDIKKFDTTLNKERSILANAARHYDDRHFRNVQLKSKDEQWVSEEFYDWRFFNKKLNNLNKRIALHNVVENYLTMCQNLGIITWLAAESLVSQRENGLIGPWEDVIKFELPAEDLNRIATSFNYSLVISDPRNNTGSSSYLIDISPWFLERARYNDGGASPDSADGRMIDVKTGVYIELVGVLRAPRIPVSLAEKNGDRDVSEYVVSSSGKFWYLPNLLPLNKTLYEGKLANVPRLFPEDEGYEVPSSWTYQDHLRLFVDREKCSYVPEEEKEKFEQTYIGCCHDNLIWKEYNYTRFASLQFQDKKQYGWGEGGVALNILDEVTMGSVIGA